MWDWLVRFKSATEKIEEIVATGVNVVMNEGRPAYLMMQASL